MKKMFITALNAAVLGLNINYAQAQNVPKEQHQEVTKAGSNPSVKGSASYFTGNVRIDPLFDAKETAPSSGGYVTFEPGARSFWHIHPVGQHLVVTNGVGWTGDLNGVKEEIKAGDVVWCPPGVKHWHGATPTTSMTHMALTGVKDGLNVEWMEEVTEKQYNQ